MTRCAFRQVRVWSRTQENARKFAAEIHARVCDSAEEAVRDADVICTVTFSTTPVIKADWIKPGAHINGTCADCANILQLQLCVLYEYTMV